MQRVIYREGHKDLITKVNSNFSELSMLKAPKPIQIPSLVLLSANWSFVSGLYEYNLSVASITADSIVDVIPDNADIETVKTAQILPKTVSSSGMVKLYATNAPASNIGITLNIF